MSNLIPPNSFHIQVRQASFRRCSLYPLRSIVPLPYAGTYSRKKMDHPPGLFPFPACRLKVGALSSSRLIFSHYNTTANGLAIDIVIPTFFLAPARAGRRPCCHRCRLTCRYRKNFTRIRVSRSHFEKSRSLFRSPLSFPKYALGNPLCYG